MIDLSELPPKDRATHLQRQAADPIFPRIVNANAGSGKTKVLVDRVSRILLQDTDPGKILCLTYTRAAASEMQERLFRDLSRWSIASDADLKAALETLFGMPLEQVKPQVDLAQARTLFARALETPEGLKVMTIHAFCERIIARFPVEAGVLPGFKLLEEAECRRTLLACRTRLLERAMSDPILAAALHRLTRLKADKTLDALLFDLARDQERMERWVAKCGVAGFRIAMGVSQGQTEADIARAALAATNVNRLKSLAAIAKRVWAKADNFLLIVDRVCKAADPVADLTAYAGLFLTNTGGVKKRVLVQAVQNEDNFLEPDGPEMRRVIEAYNTMKAARLADTTEALFTLGRVMADDYAKSKHAARGLDFTDLILKTRDLLRRKDVSDWVSYKLDGGVEHVLLDEAQDTSPTQWAIIDAITESFAQDAPDRDKPPRTFFAVGDPKQSIYRFQGAAPELFIESVQSKSIPDAPPIELGVSFRSAQEILDVVDAVFSDQKGMQALFDLEAEAFASDFTKHIAARTDKGVVELWPIVPKSSPLEDKEPWDTTPVNATSDGDPRVRLARTIAEQIAHWIETGEPVFDRDMKATRPIHAGDVLILVQKRVGGLFEALIKALKDEKLPVAGADRLVLKDAVIVRDLLALTRFVLLPSDCLSLAEVLKSPLYGLDDDALFDLCVDRGSQGLWETVKDRDPKLAAHLQDILDEGDLPPYAFYARLLDRTGPHGQSYRNALFARLGMDAREALEAFLAQALSHEQGDMPSLLRFMQAFERDTVEIKRDKDPAGREVRVMTVHGAKGLEAPIVFLPDTTRVPKKGAGGLIPDGRGGFVLAPSKDDSFAEADALKEADYAQDMREYMRLLYVAMTRAESRLVICGYHHGPGDRGFVEGSWYDWALKTLSAMKTEKFSTAFDGEGQMGLRYGRAAMAPVNDIKKRAAERLDLPDWISRKAPRETNTVTEATPSHLLREAGRIARRPSAGGYQRGIAIHALLEHLPDHPKVDRGRVARAILDGYPNFNDAERDEIEAQVFTVLDHPDFANVFAHGSRAEVSLAGRIEKLGPSGVFLTAQVDRLSVVGDIVYLVDYKSGHKPPESENDIAPAYLAQMAAYRALAREIWPNHTVRCGLLWTEAPVLTWLSDEALDTVLTQVQTVLNSSTS